MPAPVVAGSAFTPEKSPIEDYFLSLYSEYVRGNEGMHGVFQEDDVDFLAISPTRSNNSPSNYRKWIGNVYGISTNHDPNGWKDTSHYGGMKLRAKFVAMVAHLYQNLTKDGRVTGALKLTEESDIEELHRKGKLEVEGGQAPTDEQVQELVEKIEARLEKAEKQVLDNKQESGAEEVYHQVIHDYAKYGVCAIELGIREEKRLRNYTTQVVYGEGEESESLEIVTKPGFKETFVVGQRRISPYNVLLDPHASGNPQKGIGYFIKEKLNFTEVADLMSKEGNWDLDAIRQELSKYEAEKLTGGGNQSNTSSGQEGQVSISEASIQAGTHPFILKKFWGRMTVKQLEESIRGSRPIFAKMKEALIKEHGEKKYKKEFASFEVNLMFLNDVLVYAAPNFISNRIRPLGYCRMIPVEDTNYGFGVMALGRETARTMTDLFNRSKNNATIVGSAMFSYDPAVVDEQTLIFRPGGKVRFKPGSTLVRGVGPNGGSLNQLKFESVSAELMALFAKLEGLLDELTLIPSNLVGVSQQHAQTATEVQHNLNSAQVILLDIRRGFDREIIAQDLKCTYHYLQVDPDTEKDALIDANVVVYGAETFALQLMNKQMVTELLQMTPKLIDIDANLRHSLNWKNILVMSMEGIGFDKDKVLNTPQIASQLDMAAQQIQQLSEAAEQMQEQQEASLKEMEQLEKELDSTKLQNAALQSKTPLEARLNIEQIETKNLRQEIKNQQAIHAQEIETMRAELKIAKAKQAEEKKNDSKSDTKSKTGTSSKPSKASK